MDVREKLVELLSADCCPDDGCEFCDYADFEGCRAHFLADSLIAHGVTVQEWISVDDRLPEEKVDCFVNYQHAYCYNDDYWAIGICFYDGKKFQLNPAYKVTHWMPMPEPPKGE